MKHLMFIKTRFKMWLITKLGGEIPKPRNYVYRVTAVTKSGETLPMNRYAIKGHNVYGGTDKDLTLLEFLPYGVKSKEKRKKK